MFISMATTTHNLIERPPVVVVLGHIDHGKSTLLDYIRKENTVAEEVGGITQHLSAYEVIYTNPENTQKKITFLDTPGHEAFQTQRSRGARVADVAILVVSAEDGVKTQTLEAHKAIAAADIPFVVAINKIDSPKADIEKTIAGLTENSIFLEEHGGSVPYAAVSAKTGDGVPELLELILLVAEVSELRADPTRPASGIVIESARDPQRGIEGTLVIRDGTLAKGMYIAAGAAVAPVRIMEDANGISITRATVSAPVRVVGWSTLPAVGEQWNSFATKKEADDAREHTTPVHTRGAGSDEPEETAERVVIPLIIKTDTAGSIDAILHELRKFENDWLTLRVIKTDVGDVGEADIKAAGGDANTIIVGFNTDVESGTRELAERMGIVIHTSRIIYELSEWLGKEIAARKPIVTTLETRGSAKILKTFSITKRRQVVGARVTEGALATGNRIRVLRRDAEIGGGHIVELQVARAAVREVSDETEFGMNMETTVVPSPGDIIEAVVEVTT